MWEPMIRPWCPCVGHGVLPLSQGEGRQTHPYIDIRVRRGMHVVIERYMWSTGSVGSDTRGRTSHARGGMHETRERSQRAESDRCVEKYRCISRICASRRAISRLYMYMRSGGGNRTIVTLNGYARERVLTDSATMAPAETPRDVTNMTRRDVFVPWTRFS